MWHQKVTPDRRFNRVGRGLGQPLVAFPGDPLEVRGAGIELRGVLSAHLFRPIAEDGFKRRVHPLNPTLSQEADTGTDRVEDGPLLADRLPQLLHGHAILGDVTKCQHAREHSPVVPTNRGATAHEPATAAVLAHDAELDVGGVLAPEGTLGGVATGLGSRVVSGQVTPSLSTTDFGERQVHQARLVLDAERLYRNPVDLAQDPIGQAHHEYRNGRLVQHGLQQQLVAFSRIPLLGVLRHAQSSSQVRDSTSVSDRPGKAQAYGDPVTRSVGRVLFLRLR